MRQEIYEKILERLVETGVIKHIDLWNHNVEFLEQEVAWDRPAVFVEFGVITWTPVKGHEAIRGSGTVRLHIVTDWCGEPPQENCDTETAFGIADVVHGALAELSGDSFHGWELAETHTNHNHEDIVENIEVYRYRGSRVAGDK